ncbi:MAG: hypothetical protein U9N73_10435 [Candidatus Auribacterota bacterium]|nr:hypothetical protein [Candidatus Auribacterota bacterium]
MTKKRHNTIKKKDPIMDVICPSCRGVFHQTTKDFNAQSDVTPNMLVLKEPYLSNGWDSPPPDPTAGYGSLECPGCGAMLAPNGKLTTKERFA